MNTYSVTLDGRTYEESANLISEVLDNANPSRTSSRLVIKRKLGLTRNGSGWATEYGPARKYAWNEFEGEWERCN